MKTFLVRVELHAAIERDYQVLHSEMAKLGFGRQIRGSNGALYDLPTAEYVIDSSLDIVSIRNHAKAAANKTGKTSWILVAEANQLAWELKQV